MWGFGKSRGDSAWNSLWLWSLLIAVWRAPSTFLSDTGSELTVGGSTSGRNRGHSWTLGPPTCFHIQTVFLWLGYFCILTLCLWNWEIVFVCFLVCMYEEVREKKNSSQSECHTRLFHLPAWPGIFNSISEFLLMNNPSLPSNVPSLSAGHTLQ